ncbi:hypothetical protein AVEN_162279-1, partial [Araneus ventricosus]
LNTHSTSRASGLPLILLHERLSLSHGRKPTMYAQSPYEGMEVFTQNHSFEHPHNFLRGISKGHPSDSRVRRFY